MWIVYSTCQIKQKKQQQKQKQHDHAFRTALCFCCVWRFRTAHFEQKNQAKQSMSSAKVISEVHRIDPERWAALGAALASERDTAFAAELAHLTPEQVYGG